MAHVAIVEVDEQNAADWGDPSPTKVCGSAHV
jgi:hypothetical protein